MGQNKHKTVFGSNPAHNLWELRWNFLFSLLPTMHFTAYKCELVKSFQRIILGRKPRSKTQLQSNANGLKNLPVKYGQVKGLVKRKPFIPDTFSKWPYQTSKVLVLNFNTELHPSSLLALHNLHCTLCLRALRGTEMLSLLCDFKWRWAQTFVLLNSDTSPRTNTHFNWASAAACCLLLSLPLQQHRRRRAWNAGLAAWQLSLLIF